MTPQNGAFKKPQTLQYFSRSKVRRAREFLPVRCDVIFAKLRIVATFPCNSSLISNKQISGTVA